MAGFSDLIEVLVSSSVELGGNGIIHGGKGVMLAGARKIGWASGGGQRQGKRFAGHSIAGKRMASSGSAGITRSALGNYDPKQAYRNQTLSPYARAMRSGSGAARGGIPTKTQPAHLFGRSNFDRPSGPLGREKGERYSKHRSARPNSYTKSPRSNIKFK
jgi:hypothetical protein